jgi:SagB-type dehydrogenase family enzyme
MTAHKTIYGKRYGNQGMNKLNAALPKDRQPVDLAEIFHENSKLFTYMRRNRKAAEINFNPLILQLMSIEPKQYISSSHVKLPSAKDTSTEQTLVLEKTIHSRKSRRQFSYRSLNINELSKLLYLSNGVLSVEANAGYKTFRRAVPTSGALCSVEIYPIVLNVRGLEQGVYHYDSLHHQLDYLRKGDFRDHVQKRLIFQQEFSNASTILILTSWFSKLKFKYNERGYRYALLDAGHVGAHIYLVSTALGLACCGICGFLDDEVNRLIAVNGLDESAVYLLAVGTKSKQNEKDWNEDYA